MTVQDLLRVLNDETWVIVKTDNPMYPPKYNGKIIDIPVSFLDTVIKSVTSIDFNYLFVMIA